MGSPNTVNPLLNGGTPYYVVNDSLRFRSSATAYLNRTFGTPTNQQKWTWSGWVKRGDLSATGSVLFSGYSGAGNQDCYICFGGSTATGGTANTLALFSPPAGNNISIVSNNLYRDPSAWYHVVVAVDTTQATAANRVRMYINAVEVSYASSTYPTLNQNLNINSNRLHQIGAYVSTGAPFDGYMAEINFIDGQQLTPSSFGLYDNNGIWQPKKYVGSYGANGFWLPFYTGYSTTSSFAGSFNGTNQFLNVAASASLAPGISDFTVEANVNFSALPGSGSYAGIFENQIATTSATSDKFYFGLNNNAGVQRLIIGQHSTANVAFVNWTPTVGTWYHVAVVRQSGTTLLFINGVQQSVTNSTIFNGVSFGQNGASIGAISTPFYFNGYISNARYVVGSAVYTASFTPPSANLTAVTNTQLLTLQDATIIDNSSAARTITNNNSVLVSVQYPFQYTFGTIGADYSGNGNNWTTNNISTTPGVTYDIMLDSPTVSNAASNYCVLNPLNRSTSALPATIVDGNLKLTTTTSGAGSPGAFSYATSTMVMTSGKYYAEFIANYASGSAGTTKFGLTNNFTFNYNGGNYIASNFTSAYTQQTPGTLVQIAYDATNGLYWFGTNGTFTGNPSAGTGGTTLTAPAMFFVEGYNDSVNRVDVNANFGQRPFSYTPPSGFNALNTENLPNSLVSNGARYMAATTYTGTGASNTISNSANNTIGTTFQPDLVWIKSRSAATDHKLTDVIRGVTKAIISDTTGAETTDATGLTAFLSTGFTVGADTNYNNNTATYVAWQWNAGSGSTSSNTSGTITSTTSVNATAGFSIVTYTGTGANATVGHGLGVAPSLVIVKRRDATSAWPVRHASITPANTLYLNTTALSAAATTVWNSTAPTSTVFSIGTSTDVNANTGTYVAYCWSAVDGYSAFGSYIGNGNADGTFIYLGFRPRFMLIKASSTTESWILLDTSRDTYNIATRDLYPNLANAETLTTVGDIVSNGFKMRQSATGGNQSNRTYIYAAFAENPFAFARAR